MSIHYKFKSTTTSDTVKFDGLHISVSELKSAICQQKKLGKGKDSELQIRDADTLELYADDGALIPKNTSLIVQRVPNPHYSKHARQAAAAEEAMGFEHLSGAGLPDPRVFRGEMTTDDPDVSEEDRIRAMMIQSTQEYDPSRYMRIRGAGQHGPVPHGYVCHRCKRRGHWIRNCPYPDSDTKRSTGIPSSFLTKVEGPNVPGAMLTPSGDYAVMKTADEAYKKKKKKDPPPFAPPGGGHGEGGMKQKENREPGLVCPICDDYANEAVKAPCCDKVYCDDCIRQKLIEEQVCPNCNAIDMPPTSVVPATDARLRIRLLKANADGIINEADLKIGVLPDEEPGPSSSMADDDDIQEVTPVRRKRRKHRSKPITPGEVISLDDDEDDGDDLVIVEEVTDGSVKSRRKRARGAGSKVEVTGESTDAIVVL